MKIKHILKAAVFSNVIKKGRMVRGSTVAVYLLPGEPVPMPTVGVVISKKVAPRAVQRNYIKRLIYGYFRDRRPESRRHQKTVVRVTRNVKDMKKSGIKKAVITDLDRTFKIIARSG